MAVKGVPQTHVVSKPYADAVQRTPAKTLCETCDRTIPSKDWPAHERSKKHVALKEAAKTAEADAAHEEKRVEAWAKESSNADAAATTGDDAWNADATGGDWAAEATEGGDWGAGTSGGAGDSWGSSGANGNSGFGSAPARGGGRSGAGGFGGNGGSGGGGDGCFKCGRVCKEIVMP